MAAIDGKTARKYAKALFELCGADEYETMRDALRDFSQAWESSTDLQAVMKNPAVSKSEKQAVIKEICTAISPGTENFSNFCMLLLENGRLSGIGEIAREYSALIDHVRKVLSLEITSAFDIPESEKSSVAEQVRSQYGSLASFDWKVNEELIGGLLVKTGDKLLDSSVKGSLEKLRASLTNI